MEVNKVYCGDCKDVLKTLPENSVDSICCDPPYELGFMGKSWDNTGIANNKEMWAECLRVLKPGGHLLAFSGTRTYHRMASAIEDAGFEVRDMIEWVYGSGFPKSLNIGKAVDKLQGNERNVVGKSDSKGIKSGAGNYVGDKYKCDGYDLTKGTSEWEGWGTALKPSHESIAVAQKPFDTRSDIDYTISICQTLFAQIVKKSSELNLNEKTQQSIAQWTAEKNINTLEDLSEVMDMLQSELETNLNLNIVSSWLNILGETWGAMSMFTTETKGSLTTELKILQSLDWENIFQNITQVKNNQIDGYSANVLNVENLLNAVKLKLKYILTHSAQENAISQANKLNFAPKHEPICMARKPLAEKTVAENCLKYGTGGINIDESRVGTEERTFNSKGIRSGSGNYVGDKDFEGQGDITVQGRFPANLLHDNSEEVRECFPETKGGGSQNGSRKWKGEDGDGGFGGWAGKVSTNHYISRDDGTGNASRFFKSIIYQSKASKSERNKGCDNYLIINICVENMEQAELPPKDILELTKKWLTELCGKDKMEKFQLDILSTTKTETNKTTTSLTLSCLPPLNIKESIADAFKTKKVNGGNPVIYAENTNELKQIITNGLMESILGAKPVLSKELLKISVNENNFHATVKPIALMEYLIKMVTPKGGIVLDPFAGSGSTLVAAKQNGFQYIGIEMTAEYIPIIEARLNAIKLTLF